MAELLQAAFLFLVMLVLSAGLMWLVSSDEQRKGYLGALGLGEWARSLIGLQDSFDIVPIAGRSSRQTSVPILEARHHVSHDAIGSPCARTRTPNPTRKAQREVYRYTDEAGRAVFSDRKPTVHDARVVGHTAEGGVGMFSTDYRFFGARRDSGFDSAVSANIDGVFRFLAKGLDLEGVEPLHVRLTVIDGERRFIAYRDRRTSTLTTTSGFYAFDGNEAVVRWMGPETTMRVVRHEIAHLALGNWLGNMPLWLNEGLAEVVERMHFQLSSATVAAPVKDIRDVARLRGSGRLPPLRTFLSMGRADWNRIGAEVAYPYAWSMVHFLLESPQRRSLTSAYLNKIAQHRCRAFDHEAYLNGAYPGGLNAFASGWAAWLAQGRPLALRY
ncbi:DUF1570 domain-containing protein [Thiocapsa sp. UBA6158]|uniref:DUF1570 domain-containing protein n=1 Tax=Thiocapsa sp. UBA6158 TaxID=1947692 RepID=UPI0025EB2E33|nr:DUF1570 domain-containing protein [Thiocapsa sp. UBA6158]